MENQAMLKTVAFGGFDKKSVIDYIYQLNESAKEAHDKLSAERDDLAASRERLSQALGEAEEKLRALQQEADEQLENERARSAELMELADGLSAEISRKEKLFAEKDEDLRRYAQSCAELEEQVAALEKERAVAERTAAQVGKLLLNAQADAEDMVTRAQNEAEQCLAQAEADAAAICAEARQQAQETLDAAHRRVREMMGDAQHERDSMGGHLREMREVLGGARKMAADALESMTMKLAAVAEAVETAQHRLGGNEGPNVFYHELTLTEESDEVGAEAYTHAQEYFFRPPADA